MMGLFNTDKYARQCGLTHRARMFGIIPGFINLDRAEPIWMARSDLLAPVEWLLSHLWAISRLMRGEEPDFGFAVGEEIPQ